NIIKLAKQKNIPIVVTNISKLVKSEKDKNVHIALQISNFRYSNIEDIEENKSDLNIILLVYKVKDPRNLGAILRTASAFDIKGIILTSRDSCPVNDTVIHTSRNAKILIARINNALKTIEELKQKGYNPICLDSQGKIELPKIKEINSKILLILGGETGIDNKIKQM
ncbi:MAG: TrmH family RNA methyltransferase, partial [Endomicrobiia bacterium]